MRLTAPANKRSDSDSTPTSESESDSAESDGRRYPQVAPAAPLLKMRGRTAHERASLLLEASFTAAVARASAAAATLAKDVKSTSAPPTVLCYVCEDDIRSQPLIRCTRTCARSVHAACWPTLRDAPADARESAAASFACTTCRMKDGDVELFRAAAGSLTVRVDSTLETTEDTCATCGGLGELILCDGCNAAYHVACAEGLDGGVPSGDWFCAACVSTRGEKKKKRGAVKGGEQQPPPQSLPPPPQQQQRKAVVPVAPTLANDFLDAKFVGSASFFKGALGKGVSPEAALAAARSAVTDFDGAVEHAFGASYVSGALCEMTSAAEAAQAKAQLSDKPVFESVRRSVWRTAAPRREKFDEESVCSCAATNSGCTDDCLNRLTMSECTARSCGYGKDADRACANRVIQRREGGKYVARPAGVDKGWGLFARQDIAAGDFIIEYVGEVLNDEQCGKRMKEYKRCQARHFYLMELSSDCVIDAGRIGNDSRFINHSCDANAGALKIWVGDELRVAIVALKPIPKSAEITYDYSFVNFSGEEWSCACGSSKCRKVLGWDKKDALRDDLGLSGGVGAGGAETFRLHELDGDLFHEAASATPSDNCEIDTALLLLRGARCSSRTEISWAASQRVFLRGRHVLVPNRYVTEGTPAAAGGVALARKRLRDASAGGGGVKSLGRRGLRVAVYEGIERAFCDVTCTCG